MTYAEMALVFGAAFAAPRATTLITVKSGDTLILEYDGVMSAVMRETIIARFREGTRLPDDIGIVVKDRLLHGPRVLRLVT